MAPSLEINNQPTSEQIRRGQGSADFEAPSHLGTGDKTGTPSATTEATEATMQDVLDQGHQNWLDHLQGSLTLATETAVTDVSVASVLSQLRLGFVTSATDVTGRGFLPLGKLIEILTPGVVRGVLREIFHEKPESVHEKMAAAIYVKGCPHSLKIMGTLMLIDAMNELQLFIDNDISDEMLPLRMEPWDSDRPYPRMLDRHRKQLVGLDGAKWTYSQAESFVTKQAELCAPFFTIRDDSNGELDYYALPGSSILPFMDIGRTAPRYGGFGTVTKVQVESSHLGCPSGTPKPEYLAIKRLHQHDATSDIHPKEVDALARRVVVPLQSRSHVSRLLFTYRLGDSYYMAFEWADSNLAELWKTDPDRFQPSSLTDSRWFFEQCLGLVFGLDGIHNPKGSFNMKNKNGELRRYILKNSHGRHSDIKPENILLYEASEIEQVLQNGSVSAPRLVLADLGCAQFNTTQTKSIVRLSRVTGVTATYSAPEVETVRVVGPKYDIWALGCVFLEHATAFIEGSVEAIHDFSKLRNREDAEAHTDPDHLHKYTANTFYLLCDYADGKKKSGFCSAVTKHSVADWIKRLESHDNCSPAMVEFLRLVYDEMLVVDCDARSDTKQLQEALRGIIKKCENSSYACSSKSQHRPRSRARSGNSVTLRQDQDQALLHVGDLAAPDQADSAGLITGISGLLGDSGGGASVSDIPDIILSPDSASPMPLLGLQKTLEKIDSWKLQSGSSGNDRS